MAGMMFNNLCQEVILTLPIQYCTLGMNMKQTPQNRPKYQFSRNWYVAEFDTAQYHEVREWCTVQFGPEDQSPNAWSRWQHHYEDRIHFRDNKDHHWFILRFGQ